MFCKRLSWTNLCPIAESSHELWPSRQHSAAWDIGPCCHNEMARHSSASLATMCHHQGMRPSRRATGDFWEFSFAFLLPDPYNLRTHSSDPVFPNWGTNPACLKPLIYAILGFATTKKNYKYICNNPRRTRQLEDSPQVRWGKHRKQEFDRWSSPVPTRSISMIQQSSTANRLEIWNWLPIHEHLCNHLGKQIHLTLR